jgi:hypothetical protein
MTEPIVRDSPRKKATKAKPVGTLATVLIAAYLILVVLALLFVLIYFWPNGRTDVYPPRTLSEFDLLWIVALAGALGSTVHALRSFYTYVGHGKLVWRWVAMYVLLPFGGATLGLVFYLVIRGGFFAPGAQAKEASPYGFAALAALVGLFSEQAILKLKDVAGKLFKEPEPGSEHFEEPESGDDGTPQESGSPEDAGKGKAVAENAGTESEPGSDNASKQPGLPEGGGT